LKRCTRVPVLRSLVFTIVLLIIVVCVSELAFLFALPLLVPLIIREPVTVSPSRARPPFIVSEGLFSLILSLSRVLSRLPWLIFSCFLVLVFESVCLLIELPMSRPIFELLRLFRLAAGRFATFGGGVLFGPITLPIRESARSLELIRLFELPAGCFATFEGGVLSGLFTLSMSDLLRLVELIIDCFLVLDVDVNWLPIMLPMPGLLLELIRLFKLAAGCLATVGGSVCSVLNVLPMRELIRLVELFVD